MDNYLEYLLEKFLIFDKSAELHEANSIDDIHKIKKLVNTSFKKLSDESFIKTTSNILENFNCYDILDFSFDNKKNTSCANNIYILYKNYKINVTKVDNTTTNSSLLEIDNNLDTSNVKYLSSIDYCINIQEKPLEIQSNTKKWNLEYKIKMKYAKSYYIFSLYNWENDEKWHVASNTNDKKTVNMFLKELEKHKIESCC
jgi:hypothetical protein